MYELSGKHTYVPMSINAVCLIVLLVLLAAFYKELAPKSNAGETHYKFHVTAIFDTLEKEDEYKGLLLYSYFFFTILYCSNIYCFIVLDFHLYNLL